MEQRKTLVIGGGLAGLTAAFLLAKAGHPVLLIEKKSYPFHRVCGEYVSNEVTDFLVREGLFPDHIKLPQIDQFHFSDSSGNDVYIPLDLGGFGISRFVLDNFLYEKACSAGVEVQTGTEVESVNYSKSGYFKIQLADGKQLVVDHVIGAYGKRSKLDKQLNRPFIVHRSPYIGVKYHIKTDADPSAVALHNFQGGYCGLNAIEEGKANLCYLGDRNQLKQHGSIEQLEREVLWRNPQLKILFTESEFLFEKPVVINEINFEQKNPIENHILMAGDAAGLITPLCGNGMAMAIHSGKLAAEAILSGRNQQEIEALYLLNWNKFFANRLRLGRNVQQVFGGRVTSVLTRHLIQRIPVLAKQIIRRTHGQPF